MEKFLNKLLCIIIIIYITIYNFLNNVLIILNSSNTLKFCQKTFDKEYRYKDMKIYFV